MLTTDPALVFEPDIDRDKALKQTCLYCEFFLTNGPRKSEAAKSQNGSANGTANGAANGSSAKAAVDLDFSDVKAAS